MTLILIRGDVGTGKTLFATGLCLDDTRAIRANYHIKDERATVIEPEDLDDLGDAAIVVIDEAWAWLECRLSGKPINIFLWRILAQSRKKQMDIVLTTQLDEVIDKRFRMMSNIVIDCFNHPDGYLYEIKCRGKRPYAVLLPFEAAKDIYPYYDTMEEIVPYDDDIKFKISNKQKRVPAQDAIIDELLAVAPAEEWTLGTVEAYFYEHRYAHAEFKPVYQRLRLRMMRGDGDVRPQEKSKRDHKKKVANDG